MCSLRSGCRCWQLRQLRPGEDGLGESSELRVVILDDRRFSGEIGTPSAADCIALPSLQLAWRAAGSCHASGATASGRPPTCGSRSTSLDAPMSGLDRILAEHGEAAGRSQALCYQLRPHRPLLRRGAPRRRATRARAFSALQVCARSARTRQHQHAWHCLLNVDVVACVRSRRVATAARARGIGSGRGGRKWPGIPIRELASDDDRPGAGARAVRRAYHSTQRAVVSIDYSRMHHSNHGARHSFSSTTANVARARIHLTQLRNRAALRPQLILAHAAKACLLLPAQMSTLRNSLLLSGIQSEFQPRLMPSVT